VTGPYPLVFGIGAAARPLLVRTNMSIGTALDIPAISEPSRSTARRARVWSDLPWFFLVLAILPTHRELLIAAGVVVVMAIAFWVRYYRHEWLLFVVGTALGLTFELGGDAIYKLQSWSEGSLCGIPAWLPLFWGLGFVFFRRFGNVLVGLDERRGSRGASGRGC
jgi:hypothetical protein